MAILFGRNFCPKIVKNFSDPNGRLALLDIDINNVIYTIGSIYAPTQDKPQEQMQFLDVLENALG